MEARYDRLRELAKSGWMIRGTEEAGLIHWILELEAGDFPEVLDTLVPFMNENDDPFAPDDSSEFVSLCLVRWYELESDLAAGWVMRNKKLEDNGKASSFLTDMIDDRFTRDPRGALAEVERYAEVMNGREGWSVTHWAELLGRYS